MQEIRKRLNKFYTVRLQLSRSEYIFEMSKFALCGDGGGVFFLEQWRIYRMHAL